MNLAACRQCGATAPELSADGLCLVCQASTSEQPTVGASPRVGSPFQTETLRFETMQARGVTDYELLAEIAKGGMGVVYKARQISLNRLVALKMILSGIHAGKEEIARFHTEAEAAANLTHPNIVQIYETGETDGRHFFSMQLVEGGNLSQRTEWFKTSPREAAALIAKVARAVHFAHQHGILHRDLKPANILLDQNGEPHISDFGLARRTTANDDLTLSGAILGTPNYMAPEQAQGKTKELTTAADVYSLGTILYQLITGRVPFQAGTPLETLRLVLSEEPARPSSLNLRIDRDLETICLKCLEKSPVRRYGSAEALALDLERWLRHEPIVARPGTAWTNTVKWVRRRPSTAIVIATIALSLAGLIGILGNSRARLRHERDVALAEKSRAENLLNEMQLGKAEDQFAAGDTSTALANLAQILRRDPSNRLAAARAISALDYRSFARRTTNATDLAANFNPSRVLTNFAGKSLVLAWTNFVRVIDSVSGRTLFTLPHQDLVLFTTFSPDGRLIATSSQDGTARLWNAENGSLVGSPLKHDHYVIFANFSPDSRLLVTGSEDSTAKIWNATNGEQIGPALVHQGFLSSALFSEDGTRLLTTARDGTIRLWNPQTGEPLMEPINQTTLRAWLSAEGRVIKAMVSMKPETYFYWSVPGARMHPAQFPQQTKMMSINFSPDGTKFVTGRTDGTAAIWNVSSKALAVPLLRHTGTVWHACFSPDGTRVLTASIDHTARVWDAATGDAISAPMPHDDWVLFAQFSPDGKKVATASGDNTARIWDAQTGKPLTPPLTNSAAVRSLFFNHRGDRIVTGGRKAGLYIWDAATGKLLAHTNLNGVISTARFSPDDQTVLTAAYNGEAQIWDARTGRPVLPPFKHNSVVNSAEFSPDGSLVVTASSDHSAKVWNAHSGELISAIAHKGEVEYVEFFPDGQRFVTVSRDMTARIWDTRTGHALSESLRHNAGFRKFSAGFSQIGMADLSDDGKSFATIGDDGTAWVWNVTAPTTAAPLWLPDLLETIAGKKLTENSVETVSSDNAFHLRPKIAQQPADDFYSERASFFIP